jgi:predicted DNA-binding protein
MSIKNINYTIRFSPEFKFQLEKIAYEQGRPLSNLITHWLTEKMEEYEAERQKK